MSEITDETTLEELGAIVCQALLDEGIESFLSGGAVVSIYTKNAFESFDLDFVTYADRKKIRVIMEGLGFSQSRSRLYQHPESVYLVEFPGTSMSIGDEPIVEFAERKLKGKTLKLLTPTDCVKDRLAAFIHWNDRQGLEQAVLVAKAHPVNLDRIKAFCKTEGSLEAFKTFRERLSDPI